MEKSKSAPQGQSLRAVARELGIDPGQLTRESQQQGFPSALIDGKRSYITEQVRQWRVVNKRPRTRKNSPADCRPNVTSALSSESPRPGSAGDSPSPLPSPALDGNQYLLTLRSGTAEPIDISRIMVQLLARQLADDFERGTLTPLRADALKKQLQEVRQGEQDDIDIKKQRRELVTIQEVKAGYALLATMLVRGLENFANGIGVELPIWLKQFGIDAPPDLARLAQAYMREQCRAFRQMAAEKVETLIDRKEET